MAGNVLIVDDSSIARRQARNLVENEGFQVSEARNGVQGLSECKSHAYKLIITDFNMPGMDGLSMVQQVRKLNGYQNIPVFMITTELSKDLLQQGKQAGVSLWVRKPFNEKDLRVAVRRAMGGG